MSTGARAIDALNFRSEFVSSLPGDSIADNFPRTVKGALYSRVDPTAVSAPALAALSPGVASLLDLSPEPTPLLVEALAGNRVLDGMKPYAACYGGHQFGNWAGQLGDGRAITLTEVINGRDERWEMQLKGAGTTPYSRGADGRAVLRSSLREFVCSEAMHHLGVPTTRALSLVLTGDKVERDMLYDGHPADEPGAVVCRVAPTFVRFGNFQLFAARDDVDSLRRLVEHVTARYFPEHAGSTPESVEGFFAEVCRRTARLMVEWTRVGFVHGVMNTDNMSILGLTIDYGPYGWMDSFNPEWTPNTTDSGQRRYRFGQQPHVARWNLVQLANALVPLTERVEGLTAGLRAYLDTFEAVQRTSTLGKLGLTTRGSDEEDGTLSEQMYALLVGAETDMTLFFRALAEVPLERLEGSDEGRFEPLRGAYYQESELTPALVGRVGQWVKTWLIRVRAEGVGDAERAARMNAVNPLYVPRNYLAQTAIDRATVGDLSELRAWVKVLERPYDAQPGAERFAAKRPDWARRKVGCSMLSCSS